MHNTHKYQATPSNAVSFEIQLARYREVSSIKWTLQLQQHIIESTLNATNDYVNTNLEDSARLLMSMDTNRNLTNPSLPKSVRIYPTEPLSQNHLKDGHGETTHPIQQALDGGTSDGISNKYPTSPNDQNGGSSNEDWEAYQQLAQQDLYEENWLKTMAKESEEFERYQHKKKKKKLCHLSGGSHSPIEPIKLVYSPDDLGNFDTSKKDVNAQTITPSKGCFESPSDSEIMRIKWTPSPSYLEKIDGGPSQADFDSYKKPVFSPYINKMRSKVGVEPRDVKIQPRKLFNDSP